MSNRFDQQEAKQYIRPMPATWWLKKRSYFLFMLREWTCVFVGGYAVFLLALVALTGDAEQFQGLLLHPLGILLQIVALPMVLYHSITWINLTPKVMVVWRGEDRVNPLWIAGSNYIAWISISVVVAWFALR